MSTWTIKAVIMPKPGVNDPQGEAIRRGLHSLEFAEVQSVRAGKQIVISLEADTHDEAVGSATRMCDQLLANPVTEVYTIDAEKQDGGDE